MCGLFCSLAAGCACACSATSTWSTASSCVCSMQCWTDSAFVNLQIGGRLRSCLLGDDHVVNCLEQHPLLPLTIATSGQCCSWCQRPASLMFVGRKRPSRQLPRAAPSIAADRSHRQVRRTVRLKTFRAIPSTTCNNCACRVLCMCKCFSHIVVGSYGAGSALLLTVARQG